MVQTVMRTSTAVVAGSGPLATRVMAALAPGSVAVRRIDLEAAAPDVRAALEGVETVLLLQLGSGRDLDGTGGSELDVAGARRLIAAAAEAGVTSLVLLSSAMAYGAHADNPIPLTEDAALRPPGAVPYAVARVELERVANEFRFRRSGTRCRVAVLRPVVVLGPDDEQWLRTSPWGRRGVPPDDNIAPRQYVHVDDVVRAVTLACRAPLDGTYNVAPDGWIAGDTFRELAGAPVLPLPLRARRVLRRVREMVTGTVVPDGVEPYNSEPWVIASDRLRHEGWEPAFTSEEAFVEADHARGWRALSPRTRQEISLGAVGALVLGAITAVALLVRRARRR